MQQKFWNPDIIVAIAIAVVRAPPPGYLESQQKWMKEKGTYCIYRRKTPWDIDIFRKHSCLRSFCIKEWSLLRGELNERARWMPMKLLNEPCILHIRKKHLVTISHPFHFHSKHSPGLKSLGNGFFVRKLNLWGLGFYFWGGSLHFANRGWDNHSKLIWGRKWSASLRLLDFYPTLKSFPDLGRGSEVCMRTEERKSS